MSANSRILYLNPPPTHSWYLFVYDLQLCDVVQWLVYNQQWWAVTFMISLYKILTSIVLSDSLYCLVGFHTLSKQASVLEKSMARHWRKPPASRNRSLCPTSQNYWILPTCNELWSRTVLCQLLDQPVVLATSLLQPCEELWIRGSS